ncbi:MAG: hypothetical protein WAL41_21875, partial [Mycobacterium sp.]
LGQLAHLLDRVDAVHGLYYLLLHGWMAVGTSPAVMRVPSVIARRRAASSTSADRLSMWDRTPTAATGCCS